MSLIMQKRALIRKKQGRNPIKQNQIIVRGELQISAKNIDI